MKVQFNDKLRNLTFFLIIVILSVCLFVTNNISKKQDKVFAEESNQFKYALQLLSEDKAQEAEPLLKDLSEKHADNYEIIWNYGTLQSHLKKYDMAEPLFQKAQKLNVLLVKNPLFLAQYGEVLYNLGEFEKSKVYLEESLKYNPDEKMIGVINTMLENIKQKEYQQ